MRILSRGRPPTHDAPTDKPLQRSLRNLSLDPIRSLASAYLCRACQRSYKYTEVISICGTYLPWTAAVRDSAFAPVQGLTRGAASERMRIAGPIIHQITAIPINQYTAPSAPAVATPIPTATRVERQRRPDQPRQSAPPHTQPPPHRASQTDHEPPRHPPVPSRKRRRNPTSPKVGPTRKSTTPPTTWAHTQRLLMYIYIPAYTYACIYVRLSREGQCRHICDALSGERWWRSAAAVSGGGGRTRPKPRQAVTLASLAPC